MNPASRIWDLPAPPGTEIEEQSNSSFKDAAETSTDESDSKIDDSKDTIEEEEEISDNLTNLTKPESLQLKPKLRKWELPVPPGTEEENLLENVKVKPPDEPVPNKIEALQIPVKSKQDDCVGLINPTNAHESSKNPERSEERKQHSPDHKRRRSRSRSRSRDRYKRRDRSRDRSRRSHSRSKHRRRRHSTSRSRSRSSSRSYSKYRHHRHSKRRRSRSTSGSRSHRSSYKSRNHDKVSSSPSHRKSESRSVPPADADTNEVDMKIDEEEEEQAQDNVFKNDGTFLEMFKKMQEQQKAKDNPPPEEQKKPLLPAFGKRRGGKVLKTGMVQKVRHANDEEANGQDAWAIYMKEVRKYKEACCDDDSKTRPLVK